MSAEGLAFDVARTLQEGGIDYMLVGSFASNQYGIPRSTKDADFVIDVRDSQFGLLSDLFEGDWEVDTQLGFETITGSKKLELRWPKSEFVVELFFLTTDPHHQERWARRVCAAVGEEEYWFPTAEDVIIQKLRWGRGKDLEDVRTVISVQANALDYDYIERWCGIHDTLDRLHKLRVELPPDLGGYPEQ